MNRDKVNQSRVVKYSSLESLITRMDGTRIGLDLNGVTEKEWIDCAYFVPLKDGSIIVTFINSHFIETKV